MAPLCYRDAIMNVFVGLSGGVDSAVSAYTLQKEGHMVRGVFLKGWYPPHIPCTWKEDRQDAMRVAAHLSLPFTTLDVEEEYKTSVIDYLIKEYKEGRTPNPDVFCNQDVKFGAFLKWARESGADKIATGHYARVEEVNGVYKLLKGKDSKKDQSYFLYALTQEELAHTLFPLGNVTEKRKTRELALRAGLPIATKRDSQGLCFIGHVDLKEFLRAYITLTPGEVRTTDGEKIGMHDGIELFTLGQRHGFHSASDEPLYVLTKDLATGVLTVGTKQEQHAQAPKEITLTNCTWTHKKPESFDGVTLQYRYHGEEVPVARFENNTVVFKEVPKEMPAPGQIGVFYRGEECLGGGTIVY